MKKILLKLGVVTTIMAPLAIVVACEEKEQPVINEPGVDNTKTAGEQAVEEFLDLNVQTIKASFDELGSATGNIGEIKMNFGLTDVYYNKIMELIPIDHTLIEVSAIDESLVVVFVNDESSDEYSAKIGAITYYHEIPAQIVINNLENMTLTGSTAHRFEDFNPNTIFYEGRQGRYDEFENIEKAFHLPNQSNLNSGILNIAWIIRKENNASYFFELFSLTARDHKIIVEFKNLVTGEIFTSEITNIEYDELTGTADRPFLSAEDYANKMDSLTNTQALIILSYGNHNDGNGEVFTNVVEFVEGDTFYDVINIGDEETYNTGDLVFNTFSTTGSQATGGFKVIGTYDDWTSTHSRLNVGASRSALNTVIDDADKMISLWFEDKTF